MPARFAIDDDDDQEQDARILARKRHWCETAVYLLSHGWTPEKLREEWEEQEDRLREKYTNPIE
jgi:hypothetical protein